MELCLKVSGIGLKKDDEKVKKKKNHPCTHFARYVLGTDMS